MEIKVIAIQSTGASEFGNFSDHVIAKNAKIYSNFLVPYIIVFEDLQERI